MSNDSAEKRQAFERWVSKLRTDAGASPIDLGEESGVTSLEDQKTLVRHLPKDVVRKLREREAHRHTGMDQVDPDSTAIFQPPPELIARARRLVPPPKPERSVPPPDPVTERLALPLAAEPLAAEPLAAAPLTDEAAAPLPTPVVAPPLAEEAFALPDLSEPPLPALTDAVESDAPPPAAPPPGDPVFEPAFADPLPRRATRIEWAVFVLGGALVAAGAWFVLTH